MPVSSTRPAKGNRICLVCNYEIKKHAKHACTPPLIIPDTPLGYRGNRVKGDTLQGKKQNRLNLLI
jgi:hypothetical protein